MILVTGGLGFIGSAYIWHLNQKGFDNIVIYDQFRNQEKWKNVSNLKFQDLILSSQDINQISKYSFEAIVHLGACSDTMETDMDFLFKNNYELSKKLWYIAAGEQIPFIYASSAATYGKGEFGFDDTIDINQLKPLNKYGYSKQLFDLWVCQQQKSKEYINPPFFAGFKFFNVFGPNEYHKKNMASVVYHAYEQIKKQGKVKLFKSYHLDYENGKQLRDFVYVKEVCHLMEFVRHNHSSLDAGLYNIGSGTANTFKHLVESVFKALNRPPKIEYIDMPKELQSRYQYFTEAKMEKLTNACNPFDNFPRYTLEDAIKDYVVHYLEQESPYLSSI